MTRFNAMAEAKYALVRDIARIVPELVPGGSKRGRIYSAKNPARADRSAGSFVVWMAGAGAGAWKDYSTGEQGDIIDLVCLAKACNRKTALEWARDRCGLRKMDPATRQLIQRQAEQQSLRQAETEKTRSEKRRLAAELMFAKAARGVIETPVDRYLKSRGIDLMKVETLERRWLRYLPEQEWWMGRERDQDGRVSRKGPSFPCMIAGFVDANGKQRACHLTFLRPDGSGKAPVEKPKLIWPEHLGLTIRLAMGETGLEPEAAAEAKRASPCAIVEGIEDGLTLALADPGLRVWAAGSLAGLAAIPDHACVSDWIVARDNDWGKSQAAKLFDRAMRRLRSFGKPVQVVASASGKDFNDQLRGVA
jgi:hypothetical protein